MDSLPALGCRPVRGGGGSLYRRIKNATTGGHFLELWYDFDGCVLPRGTADGYSVEKMRLNGHSVDQGGHLSWGPQELDTAYHGGAGEKNLVCSIICGKLRDTRRAPCWST